MKQWRLLQNLVEQPQEECTCDERLGTEARSAMFESAQRCPEDCLELLQQYTARDQSAGGAKSPREGRHLDSPQRTPRRGGRWGCRCRTACALEGRHNEPSHCHVKCCVCCGALPGRKSFNPHTLGDRLPGARPGLLKCRHSVAIEPLRGLKHASFCCHANSRFSSPNQAPLVLQQPLQVVL